MMNEKDVEYLEEKFPKGKTKFRGEAMVLLTLARLQGEQQRNVEVKQIIEKLPRYIWSDDGIRECSKEYSSGFIKFTELLQKLGLEK